MDNVIANVVADTHYIPSHSIYEQLPTIYDNSKYDIYYRLPYFFRDGQEYSTRKEILKTNQCLFMTKMTKYGPLFTDGNNKLDTCNLIMLKK